MASITPFLRHWLAIVFVQTLASECGGLVLGQDYIGEPRDVVVRKGESFTWPCKPIQGMGASTQVNVTWRFNGQLIRDDTRRYVLSNGSLYFKRVRRADNKDSNDYYDCIVEDSRGTIVSRPAKLYVAGLSRSSRPEENISISQGDTVWLQCHISVTPPHAKPTYEWERDKTPLPPDSRYNILPQGVLEIKNVHLGDQGRYRCSAFLASEGRNSRQIQLTVNPGSGQQAGVQFLNEGTQLLTVKSGEKVILPCGVSGLPQPAVSWLYGNRSAVDNNRFKRIGQGSLEISNVARDYNGTYVCLASNSVTTTPVESTVFLRVLEPPRAMTDFHLKESYMVAQYVELTCNISGFPAPTIRWFHNSVPVSIRGRYTIDGNSLQVTNSVTEDSGYFQCIGENEGGTALVTGHIKFRINDDGASVPMELTVEDVTSTSLKVKWESNEAIFSVHHNTDFGVEETVVVPDTEHTITGLTPHTNYTIYVIAYNSNGASTPSNKVVKLTKDDVPLATPFPRVTSLGGSSVNVQWDPLSPSNARGVVTEYEVIYRIVDSPSENVQAVPGETHELVLTGLDPKYAYQVCVRASTRSGYSDPKLNQWVEFRTEGPSDIAAPENLNVQSLNSTVLLITWSYNGPALHGFLLQYQKLSDLASLPVDVKRSLPPESRKYLITSLEPNSWYRISLMSKSMKGEQSAPLVRESSTQAVDDSPDKNVNGGNPSELHPPQPEGVVADPHNSTAIDIQWNMRVPVDAYVVRYSEVPNNPNEDTVNKENIKTIRSSGGQTRVLITGLEQYTWYQFQVQAETGNHRGPPSDQVRCRTDEGLPSRPRNLQLMLKDDSTISVNWEPPAQSNGQILRYAIFFKNGDQLDNANDSIWNKTYVNGTTVTIDIRNLKKSASYNFKVTAITGRGAGNFSELKHIQTKDMTPTTSTERNEIKLQEDKKMGIIIGVSIGGLCIIVSIVIILLRNRCFPTRTPPSEPVTRRVNGNSYIPNVNGNGFGPHGGNVRLSSESHESFPMLPQTQIPENQQSDTRGGLGHVVMNGVCPINMNGVRVNLQPNGHVCSMPIYADDADRPQVPQRSSSLLAAQEESQRLVRSNSMESIDREEGDLDPASSQELRHSDSGSHKDRQSRSSQEQQQQPPISATSSQKQQKQQQQQQHGENNSPKMPSSTSSVSGNGPSNSLLHHPSTRAAAVSRSQDRGLDQPVVVCDGSSHDTSSTKLLPASGGHDPLPHV